MGSPGLLQELPDIAAPLPEAGGDGEQAAADRSRRDKTPWLILR
jgi:hypothetical protein